MPMISSIIMMMVLFMMLYLFPVQISRFFSISKLIYTYCYRCFPTGNIFRKLVIGCSCIDPGLHLVNVALGHFGCTLRHGCKAIAMTDGPEEAAVGDLCFH